MKGLLLEGTLLLWILIEDGIVMLVGALGTWPIIAGIGGKEEEW